MIPTFGARFVLEIVVPDTRGIPASGIPTPTATSYFFALNQSQLTPLHARRVLRFASRQLGFDATAARVLDRPRHPGPRHRDEGEGVTNRHHHLPGGHVVAAGTALLDRFVSEVEQRGCLPLVVMFPNKGDVYEMTWGLARRYQPLVSHCRDSGYRCIDILDELVADGGPSLDPLDYCVKAHYNSRANEIVARSLIELLGEDSGAPGEPPAVRHP